MTNSPLDTLIRKRRSIRRFQPDPVGEEVISELIELARWAPSPHNSQPWRFTLLTHMTKRRLGVAMGDSLRRDLENQGLDAANIGGQVARSLARIEGAPSALICSIVTSGLKFTGNDRLDELERQMAVQSIGAVMQTFFLAAADRGVGACWMAAPMYCQSVVCETVDLPKGFSPQALILLGYEEHPGRERPRLAVEELVEIR